jgi:hypothetical protein
VGGGGESTTRTTDTAATTLRTSRPAFDIFSFSSAAYARNN